MRAAPLAILFAFAFGLAATGQEPAPTPPPTPTETPQTSAPATSAPAQAPSATAPKQSPAAPTQAPATSANTITTNARIVILDVIATDAKGNEVKDLTKDDFHVTEAGDPQTITFFELGASRVPPPTVNIDSTADLDRLAPRAPVNIILLDEFNTRFEDMAFARYSLKKFLQKQPDHLTTPTMLIAVSIDKFEVLRDYTQNKQEILSALDHHFGANPWRNTSNSWASERLGTAFLTLRRVSEAVIGHQGHKNMIWIGRGFPALNMANVPVDSSNRINNAVQDCVNSLRDARVTLTTIDPAGLLVDPGVYGSAAAFNDPFGGNYQFAKLARATGGRTIYGRNDVDAQIDSAAQDGTDFYTLVYRPSNTSNDPAKFRKIKITVDRPGVTLTSREGYYLRYAAPRVNPAAPSKRLVTDLMSAETSTMVYDGVDLSLTPVPPDPRKYLIHVAARSLGWTIATETEPRRTEIIVLVSLFDKKGKELKHTGEDIKVKAPANMPPTGRIEVPIAVPWTIDPEPKAVRARFVIRVAASGRIGTADVDLTKPPVAVGANPPAAPAAPAGPASPASPAPPAASAPPSNF